MSKLAVASGASGPTRSVAHTPELQSPDQLAYGVFPGTTSLTVPPLEVDGPLLVTTRWWFRSVPATTVRGALLSFAWSACVCTVVHALSLHDALPILSSAAVVALTVAVS